MASQSLKEETAEKLEIICASTIWRRSKKKQMLLIQQACPF